MRAQNLLLLVSGAGLCAAGPCRPNTSSSISASGSSTWTSEAGTTSQASAAETTSSVTISEDPSTTSSVAIITESTTIEALSSSTDMTSTTEASATTTSGPPPIATTNRASNPGFEDSSSSPSPWVFGSTGSAMSMVTSSGARSGTKDFTFAATQGSQTISLCQPVALVTGYEYTFSAWIVHGCQTQSPPGPCPVGGVTVDFSFPGVAPAPQNLPEKPAYVQYQRTMLYEGASGDSVQACIKFPIGATGQVYAAWNLDDISINAVVP